MDWTLDWTMDWTLDWTMDCGMITDRRLVGYMHMVSKTSPVCYT